MLADVNFGAYPMSNGLSRLATRFLADPALVDKAKAEIGKPIDAEAAQALGLVTFALDDIDWEDEIRVFLEERASFSPDALTGLEANLRFGGPGNDGDQDLRPSHRLAELDFPASQRSGRGRSAQALRHRPEAGIRQARV